MFYELISVSLKIAIEYCIKTRRNLNDPAYLFCAQILQLCRIIHVELTWKRKALILLFKKSPLLFEVVCKLWRRKYTDC